MEKRGKVWLAVSGLVLAEDGRWLVVKKRYGGLKGKWSLPAGFVEPGETVDQAVRREVLEETGIEVDLVGMLGVRSGVIRGEISDNMIMFVLKAKHEVIVCQDKELFEARFLQPEDILRDGEASALIYHLLEALPGGVLPLNASVNPGDHFGYTAYHLFLPEA